MGETMPKYACIRNNYWGTGKGQFRMYEIGDVIEHHVKPNAHFELVDKVSDHLEEEIEKVVEQPLIVKMEDSLKFQLKNELEIIGNYQFARKYKLGYKGTKAVSTPQMILLDQAFNKVKKLNEVK
jgi:hypothetical protein